MNPVEYAKAEMIVDLYEIRAKTFPERSTRIEQIQNVFQYQFFDSVIAVLCDKHKISSRMIEEAIRSRRDYEVMLAVTNKD